MVSFLFYALTGGICQIMFTVFLLWLFSFHNFAVGTTISKLETVMVALFGLMLLGDQLTPPVVVAIAMSAVGLIILSAGQARLGLIGITSRAVASTYLDRPGLRGVAGRECSAVQSCLVVTRPRQLLLVAASFTLLIVVVLQNLLMGFLLAIREPDQLGKVLLHWRPAMLVGISGGLASIGWFSAFTLQNATYVRALGTNRAAVYLRRNLAVFPRKSVTTGNHRHRPDHRIDYRYPASQLSPSDDWRWHCRSPRSWRCHPYPASGCRARESHPR